MSFSRLDILKQSPATEPKLHQLKPIDSFMYQLASAGLYVQRICRGIASSLFSTLVVDW
jgi:hypothetical protein